MISISGSMYFPYLPANFTGFSCASFTCSGVMFGTSRNPAFASIPKFVRIGVSNGFGDTIEL